MTTNSTIPVRVVSLTSGATAISCGGDHSCAIVDGSAYCWGQNYYGELGNSSMVTSFTPVKVQVL